MQASIVHAKIKCETSHGPMKDVEAFVANLDLSMIHLDGYSIKTVLSLLDHAHPEGAPYFIQGEFQDIGNTRQYLIIKGANRLLGYIKSWEITHTYQEIKIHE